MSKKPAKDIQVDAINRYSPFVQIGFDLNKQDKFVTGLGADFTHYKAMPSPIGKKDRGDYRRNDGVDTITSNGMIYKCSGKFTATMTDNSRGQKRTGPGLLDPSEAHLVMPRFYNAEGTGGLADGKRIYLAPGDRLYVADPDADVKVANYHEMDYEQDVDNVPMFPIVELEAPIIDSLNIEYIQGVDFCITAEGNIRWHATGKNPGIDPDTGKGRVYSIRYLYRAFWYVTVIHKEVRVTNVTNNGIRGPERMPYYATIVREYIYHNQNRGDETNQLKSKTPARVEAAPKESINAKPVISVDMGAIGDDEEQS